MKNIYSDPEAFGTELFGSIDFESGYGFDIIAIWTDHYGGLWYAEDRGCSCPAPFEDHDLRTLQSATPRELIERIRVRSMRSSTNAQPDVVASLIDRLNRLRLVTESSPGGVERP